MIKNKVFYVKEEEYNDKLKKEEEFIKKIEIGKVTENNMELIKRIFREIGSEWYQDRNDKPDNYNAIKDYLSDISYALDVKYHAIEVYINNIELVDQKFVALLKNTIKEHEFNVAEYSAGSQRMISFDLYIKFDGKLH